MKWKKIIELYCVQKLKMQIINSRKEVFDLHII